MTTLRKSDWVLLVATILGAVLFGATVASASEPLAPGDYTISLPGIGDLTVNVADSGAVSLAAVPAGYTVAEGGEPNEWRVVSAAGLAVLTVEVEDGEIEIEAATALAAGVHSVDVPGVGTVTFTVGADGAVVPDSVTAPAGFTVTIGSDDGTTVLTVASATITATITVEDEGVKIEVAAADESDDESDDRSGGSEVESDDDHGDSDDDGADDGDEHDGSEHGSHDDHDDEEADD